MSAQLAVLYKENRRLGEDHPGRRSSKLAGRHSPGHLPVARFSKFVATAEKFGHVLKTACPPEAACLNHAELDDLHWGHSGGPVIRLRFPYQLPSEVVQELGGSFVLFQGKSGEVLCYKVRRIFRTSLGKDKIVEFRLNSDPKTMPTEHRERYALPESHFQFLHPCGARSSKMSRQNLRRR